MGVVVFDAAARLPTMGRAGQRSSSCQPLFRWLGFGCVRNRPARTADTRNRSGDRASRDEPVSESARI